MKTIDTTQNLLDAFDRKHEQRSSGKKLIFDELLHPILRQARRQASSIHARTIDVVSRDPITVELKPANSPSKQAELSKSFCSGFEDSHTLSVTAESKKPQHCRNQFGKSEWSQKCTT